MRQHPCSVQRELCSVVWRSASNTRPTPMALRRSDVTYTGVRNVFWKGMKYSVIGLFCTKHDYNGLETPETISAWVKCAPDIGAGGLWIISLINKRNISCWASIWNDHLSSNSIPIHHNPYIGKTTSSYFSHWVRSCSVKDKERAEIRQHHRPQPLLCPLYLDAHFWNHESLATFVTNLPFHCFIWLMSVHCRINAFESWILNLVKIT